jgi:hypothetical protein
VRGGRVETSKGTAAVGTPRRIIDGQDALHPE